MKTENIKNLVQKYFDGETSLTEERQLHDYFASENVEKAFEKFRPLFGGLASERRLANDRQPQLHTRQHPLKKWWAAAAAAVLIPAGAWMYQRQQNHEQQQAQMAFEQTKKALNILAENLIIGTEKVAHLKTFETTTQRIVHTENLQ
ncbi:MAG: hypothetical protein Q4G08_09420 [Capnocytophaga sp.]|nr:hypothetical protein [Capnocytophaga sp.]